MSAQVKAVGQMFGGAPLGVEMVTLLNTTVGVTRGAAAVAAMPARYGPPPMSMATVEPSTDVHVVPSPEVIAEKKVTGGLSLVSW